MSISNIISSTPIYCSNLNCKNINLNNGSLSNVAEINGVSVLPLLSTPYPQESIDMLKRNYLTHESASSTYLPLSGGELTGIVTNNSGMPHYFANSTISQSYGAFTSAPLTIWNSPVSSSNVTHSSGVFTINTSGTYIINCQIYHGSINCKGSSAQLSILLNNSIKLSSQCFALISRSAGTNVSCLSRLSSGDTVSADILNCDIDTTVFGTISVSSPAHFNITMLY